MSFHIYLSITWENITKRKRPTVYGHHRAAVQDCKHVASDDAAQVEAHQNTHAVSYLTFH